MPSTPAPRNPRSPDVPQPGGRGSRQTGAASTSSMSSVRLGAAPAIGTLRRRARLRTLAPAGIVDAKAARIAHARGVHVVIDCTAMDAERATTLRPRRAHAAAHQRARREPRQRAHEGPSPATADRHAARCRHTPVPCPRRRAAYPQEASCAAEALASTMVGALSLTLLAYRAAVAERGEHPRPQSFPPNQLDDSSSPTASTIRPWIALIARQEAVHVQRHRAQRIRGEGGTSPPTTSSMPPSTPRRRPSASSSPA